MGIPRPLLRRCDIFRIRRAALILLAAMLCARDVHAQSFYMTGFRDYTNGVSNYSGLVDELDSNQYIRLTDDLDGSGNAARAIIEADGNVIAFIYNFEALSEFNIYFDSFRESPAYAGSQSVDVTRVIWLDDVQSSSSNESLHEFYADARGAEALLQRDAINAGIEGGALGPRTYSAPDKSDLAPVGFAYERVETPHKFGLLYGIRVLQTAEYARSQWSGSILGRGSSNLRVENNAIAPHIGIVWAKDAGPWSLELQGLLLAGYNVGRVKLHGSMGREMLPGAINRPLYARPTEFTMAQSYRGISPSGELRAEARLRISQAVALRFAWNGIAVNNLLLVGDDRAEPSIPMELTQRDGEDLMVHSLYCGIEVER